MIWQNRGGFQLQTFGSTVTDVTDVRPIFCKKLKKMAATLKRNLKFNESLLECTVCLEVPSSNPIYQCRNGHLFCKECHSKLQECPVCRQGKSQLGTVRCLIAQKILENSKETDNAVQKTSNVQQPSPINMAPVHVGIRLPAPRRPLTNLEAAPRNSYCGICGK